MSGDRSVAAEARAAYARWLAAVHARDEVALRQIHHERYVMTGVDGRRIGRDEHIARELEVEVSEAIHDVIAIDLGDVLVSCGRQTVQGRVESETVPTQVRDRIARDGIDCAFTTVWVRDGGELRVVTHHVQLVGPASA